MPIPLSHMKERLSDAYIRAVVSRAGAKFNPSEAPEYGVDGEVRPIKELSNGTFEETGFGFHLQAKATTTIRIDNGAVKYRISGKAYNKLVRWEGHSFIVLVVFHLPNNNTEWLNISNDETLLRHCGYWTIIPNTETEISPDSSKVISIPKDQIFNTDAVTHLLDKARNLGKQA